MTLGNIKELNFCRLEDSRNFVLGNRRAMLKVVNLVICQLQSIISALTVKRCLYDYKMLQAHR